MNVLLLLLQNTLLPSLLPLPLKTHFTSAHRTAPLLVFIINIVSKLIQWIASENRGMIELRIFQKKYFPNHFNRVGGVQRKYEIYFGVGAESRTKYFHLFHLNFINKWKQLKIDEIFKLSTFSIFSVEFSNDLKF